MNMTADELELIKEAMSGSESAFDDLYRKYERLVYYIAYKNTRNDADAKDVVQETFLEVKRTIHTLQNPQAFKFWLNRITLSKCKNLFRKNHYVNIDSEQVSGEAMNVEERSYLIPHANSRKESDCIVLNQLINELPKGQRDVLILFYLEELHLEEIAELLDIPLGTVKSRLSYARDALKEKVERYEQKEGVKLNFHTLENGIAAALLFEMNYMELPMIKVKSVKLKTSSLSSILTSTAALKAIAAGIILFSSVAAGSFAYDIFNRGTTGSKDDTEEITREQFPTYHVFDKKISTSESAYFNLKLWLCCEDEVNALTKSEFMEIKPIYEQLKKLHNAYYQSLEDQGLADSFEALYTKYNVAESE